MIQHTRETPGHCGSCQMKMWMNIWTGRERNSLKNLPGCSCRLIWPRSLVVWHRRTGPCVQTPGPKWLTVIFSTFGWLQPFFLLRGGSAKKGPQRATWYTVNFTQRKSMSLRLPIYPKNQTHDRAIFRAFIFSIMLEWNEIIQSFKNIFSVEEKSEFRWQFEGLYLFKSAPTFHSML